MIFVGYYTRNTPYESEAAECIKTLDSFGLASDFVGVDPQGTWARNCAMKPAAILGLMRKHNRPVVYLDTDSRVRQPPVLFDSLTCDIAVHYRGGHELLSSVIYLDPKAIPIVEEWDRECQKFLESGCRDHCLFEQLALQRVLEHSAANVYKLPAGYARIFDDPRMGDPVIEQQQASRRHAVTVGSVW